MTDKTPQPPAPPREGQRIAKAMARAGLCSRRDAETWIAAGRVSVNGQVLESPAFNVSAEDDIRVDGQPLRRAERTRLFLFHKPRGLVTTARDPEGRPTIFDALPEDLPRVVVVGRLDINTEGLLLLTNDGGLARVLELPATAWLRRYRVRAHGAIDQSKLDALRDGVTIDGVHYLGIEARLEREQGSNVWIAMGLREGKNREIKRVLEHLGLSVNRLIRVSFGPFELGDLAEGEVVEVPTRVLRDQLGARLAKEAHADFDAAIAAPAPPPAAPAPRRSERGRAGGRDRYERRDRETFEASVSRQPEPSRMPRKRKHVSTLRAEIAEGEGKGPRKRIERSATSDRRGREVKVERIVAATSAERAVGRRGRVRAKFGEDRPPREARPPRGADSGDRFDKRRLGDERPPRRDGGKPFHEGRPPRDARPQRGADSGDRFDKRRLGDERPLRRDGGKPFREGRPPREARAPRGSEGGDRFDTRRDGDARPPRRDGGKPFREGRPPREARALHGPEGGERFDKRRDGDARPPRRDGGKPFGERRPSGPKGAPPRGGKPFGKRPPRRP